MIHSLAYHGLTECPFRSLSILPIYSLFVRTGWRKSRQGFGRRRAPARGTRRTTPANAPITGMNRGARRSSGETGNNEPGSGEGGS